MTIGNPMASLQRDVEAAGRDLEDLGQPSAEFSDQLAGAFREEVPVVSGYLRGSVYSDSSGVGVGAPYAGVINDSNPYADRAVSKVDPGDVFGAYVDDVLDRNLHSIYA